MKLPRENVYVCEYNCVNVTVDVDAGVTPFLMKCVRRSTTARPIAKEFLGDDGECSGTAQSTFYPRVPRPANIPAPTHEWYRPSPDQSDLLLRPRTSAEPVYHDDEPKETE